jgi:ferric-dicitrate binding protein FerR (iron transport regulator)
MMEKPSDCPREASGVHRLAALLRKDTTASVDDERDLSEWQRLLRAVHEEDARGLRRPGLLRWWILAPLVAGVVLVALGMLRGFWGPAPLRFTLDGHASGGNYLMAGGERPSHVDFSDGSSLLLHASGRLRVANTDADGATLLLERGQVDVAIRHQPSSRWQLELGPYAVRVTGTRFAAIWNPETGEVGVDLFEGALAIRGPGIVTPLMLRGGQQFRANKAGSYAVERQPPAAAVSPAGQPSVPEAAAVAAKGRHLAGVVGSERGVSRSPHDRLVCSWTDLVSQGQFAAIIAQARALGLETALAECPPHSLFVLADAARYQGAFGLSERVLLAIRQRSPDDAGKAAFFLGRLAEARGNLELALGWYAQATESSRESHFVQEAKTATTRVLRRLRTLPARPSPMVP